MKPVKRLSILWTTSDKQKMIMAIEVGRERFGERNDCVQAKVLLPMKRILTV